MRLLITGIDTPAGSALAGLLARAATEGRFPSAKAVEVLAPRDLDPSDPSALAGAVGRLAPDCLLYCGAILDAKRCLRNESLTWSRNCEGFALVGTACQQTGVRCIVLSSAAVFPPSEGPVTEFGRPVGQSLLGRSLQEGECALRLSCTNHLILRVPYLLGTADDSDLLHVLERVLAQQGTVSVPQGITCPVHIQDLAALLAQIICMKNVVGTLHISSGAASHADFVRTILQRVGAQDVPVTEESEQVPPHGIHLKSVRFATLGLPDVPTPDQTAEHLAADLLALRSKK